MPRRKSRDDSLAGSSRGHSSYEESFDFADDKLGESECKNNIFGCVLKF